jgi:hypothetical protein
VETNIIGRISQPVCHPADGLSIFQLMAKNGSVPPVSESGTLPVFRTTDTDFERSNYKRHLAQIGVSQKK